MTRFADETMIAQLKNIWSESFHDDPSYIDLLFKVLIKPENVFVDVDDNGKVTASLCIEPLVFTSPNKQSLKGGYVYGVATLPQYRGKGASTRLMENLHIELAGRGMNLSCLVPASESLFGFYAKRGYENWFNKEEVEILAEDIQAFGKPCVLKPASLDALDTIRVAHFGGSRMFAHWDYSWLKGIEAQCRQVGGQTLKFSCMGKNGYAVCYPYKDSLFIKELAADGLVIKDVIRAIAARYRKQKYIITIPQGLGIDFSSNILPYAMVRWYDSNSRQYALQAEGAPPYIAHVLD